jgi:carbamoyltransferase
MNILGLTYLSHDCGAVIISDGKLLAAVEEERLNRDKHTTSFPHKAIEYCLETAGISPKEVDYLVLPSKPFIHLANRIEYAINIFPKTFRFLWHNLYNATWTYKMRDIDAPRKAGIGENCKKIKIEHHLAHAASSFFCSPFEDAAIITTDGRGEWPCLLFASGRGNKIKTIRKSYFPHSLGQIYQAFTEYLGFPDYGDEYKVMGLSGYGKPTHMELLREIIQFKDGELTINQKFMNYHIFNMNMDDRFSTRLDQYLKCRRNPDEKVTQEHMNTAASIQARLNEVGLEIANYMQKITGSKNLCLSGGVALNGVMNHYIKQNSNFDDIYISPAPSDTGLALGAALYVNHSILDNKRDFVMEHAFWGPEFDDKEIQKYLDVYQISYKKLKDPAKKAAELIADGKVVGWFQGRMEYGPRALGNRSILGDPRIEKMKEIINSKIKFREEFRPFAPAVLKERSADYFLDLGDSPFMLNVGKVRREKKKEIPSVTHVDGTARVQTVEKRINPLFYSLIQQFEKITNVPLVINTSFNVKGEPIVCTPNDAIRCFYTSGIDDLILGDYHISKNNI